MGAAVGRDRGPSRRAKQPGFTLLELLLVVVVLASLVGLALLSVDLASDDQKLKRDATRVSELLKLGCEQAQLSGQRFGLAIFTDGWGFAQWLNDRWWATDQRPFQPRPLPAAAQPRLRVNGLPVPLTPFDSASDQIVPQIICFDSGELTPFELNLGGEGQPTIKGELNGSVQLRQ